MPTGPSPSPGGPNSAFIAAIEKIGKPIIYVGWSAGGALGESLVIARPDLFKAFVSLEATGSCVPNPPPPGTPPMVNPAYVNALVANHIPFLNVNSTTGHSGRNPGGYAPFVCQALIDKIIAAGGDATQVQTPALGIVGNSHMDFWENHSFQIAQIVVDWIGSHVH